MTPISALAILFCIYAVSELIAQKTNAIFSTVLSIAILLLAGFWSGILPRTLIDDAQITGFGNIIAGLLIVSLGTTIDFAELRRQWKVVVTALCGVCGAVAAIVLIGRPFIGSEMAIAGVLRPCYRIQTVSLTKAINAYAVRQRFASLQLFRGA